MILITAEWDTAEIEAKLAGFNEHAIRAIHAVSHFMESEAETYMRSNAPWHDNTGAARAGLGAQAFEEGAGASIVVHHSVSYGIWLEIRWSGKYAIIGPTQLDVGHDFLRLAALAVMEA